MMRRKRPLADAAREGGAALLMVLIIVTAVGLGGAALLSLSDTSIRTTIALRDEGAEAYAADGAAQLAVNSLSTGKGFTAGSLFTNASDTTCFGPNTTSGTLSLPDFYPGANGRNGTASSSASVTCTPDPATGVNAPIVPITSANRPAQAIMTLGRITGEDGINVKPLTGTPFAVKGAVKSNSNINVVSGTLQSTAAVTAFGLCSGSIVSTPSAACSTATAPVDPGYSSEPAFGTPANTVPAYKPVPADVLASCPDGVVTFLPGYYDNAMALTTLMDDTGACAGSTWWFTPGTYYFDFHNNTLDSDVYRGATTASGGSANQWGILSGNLVAGTPTDSNGNVIASPGASPVMPGTCQNPTRSTSNAGVQFIFGGDSQLALLGPANAEICGTYSATRPPIGVYGVKTGTATTRTLSGTGTTATSSLKMSTAVSPGLFTPETNVIQQDGISATWAKATAPSEASTITVTGYAPPTAIPPGSIVKTATVRVAHGNSAGYVAADRLALTFTPKGVTGSPAGPAITPAGLTYPAGTALVTNSLVIQAAGGTSTLASYVHEYGFTGADMDYTATPTHIGDENLDAIQIDISYVTPTFRNEKITTITSNCMRLVYSGASGSGCAVLSTSELSPGLSPFTGELYLQGTTYAPLGAIDLTLSRAAQQILRLGVISRSLWISQTAAFSYPSQVIETPDATTGGGVAPVVLLAVYLCPSTTTSTCHTDAGAITALRAKVMINATTAPSTMTVLSWSNLQ